jgi:hypothetical protein
VQLRQVFAAQFVRPIDLTHALDELRHACSQVAPVAESILVAKIREVLRQSGEQSVIVVDVESVYKVARFIERENSLEILLVLFSDEVVIGLAEIKLSG